MRDTMCHWQAVMIAGFDMPASDAELQQACQDFYDTCLELPPPEDPSSMVFPMCPARSASCTATVDEFELCYSESEHAFEASLAELPSCSP